ncbi:MAG: NAD-dependent epimerase/dehydratase family protein [Candidatus Schekmanbacteria bacterium]|nr:NAD-dependent epimerase/dehydratase family protein [Candidatus Schekmanbacteria bacterium]
MRVLVTGATGFIGGNVVRAVLAAGHQVRAMMRVGSRHAGIADLLAAPPPGFETVLADLKRPETLPAAAAGCEAMVHCAGYYPTVSLHFAAEVERAARQMSAVLSAARHAGVRRFVYTSSLSTIARAAAGRLASESDQYREGAVWDPYYDGKLRMEEQCRRASGPDFQTVTLLPTLCVGPGDANRTTFKPFQVTAAFPVVGYFSGRANFVDVRIVAAAHAAALTRGAPGERYVVSGANVTFADYLRRVARVLGKRRLLIPIPVSAAWVASWVSELAAVYVTGRPPLLPIENVNMALHGQHFDGDRARRELGIAATDLDRAIADAAAWYRQVGYLR